MDKKVVFAHILFITAAVLLRIYLSLHLDLISYPDTETYELFALESVNGLAHSMPTRPLGYPVFLALVYKVLGAARENAVWVQHALGVLSYPLFYAVFRRLFKGSLFSALLAFAVTVSSPMIIYERAVLSDFLNHFFLLVSFWLAIKFFEGKKAALAAPLALFAFAAVTTRPTSVLFVFAFLVFLAWKLGGEMIAGKTALATLKGAALFIGVYLALSVASGQLAWRSVGGKGEPVGVLGVTMLIRTADFIDYGSPLHRDAKEAYREQLKVYLPDYVPEYANFVAAYRLMTGYECTMTDETKERYALVAENAARFYAPKPIGPNTFTTNDILREARCDMGTVEKVFLEIAGEAVFSDPAGFSASFVRNLQGFIEVKPWEHGAFGKILEGRPAPLAYAYMRANKAVSEILAARAVSAAFTVLFAASSIAFLIAGRRSAGYTAGLFLAAFIVLNYAALGILADHPANRYKLPFWWMQGPLVVYFISCVASAVKQSRAGKKEAV